MTKPLALPEKFLFQRPVFTEAAGRHAFRVSGCRHVNSRDVASSLESQLSSTKRGGYASRQALGVRMPTLDWIGKKAVVNHHREVPYRLIHCDKDKDGSWPQRPVSVMRQRHSGLLRPTSQRIC